VKVLGFFVLGTCTYCSLVGSGALRSMSYCGLTLRACLDGDDSPTPSVLLLCSTEMASGGEDPFGAHCRAYDVLNALSHQHRHTHPQRVLNALLYQHTHPQRLLITPSHQHTHPHSPSTASQRIIAPTHSPSTTSQHVIAAAGCGCGCGAGPCCTAMDHQPVPAVCGFHPHRVVENGLYVPLQYD
jgi:hypothetical protein